MTSALQGPMTVSASALACGPSDASRAISPGPRRSSSRAARCGAVRASDHSMHRDGNDHLRAQPLHVLRRLQALARSTSARSSARRSRRSSRPAEGRRATDRGARRGDFASSLALRSCPAGAGRQSQRVTHVAAHDVPEGKPHEELHDRPAGCQQGAARGWRPSSSAWKRSQLPANSSSMLRCSAACASSPS